MTDLPVTVVGGYLGAGKTTLINNLLRDAAGLRLAVLVNEFGALAIDEDLIEAQDDDIISIAGGCICCSFGSDLTAALLRLSQLPHPPDHILIECSGVAIPGAIVASLQLISGFRSDGVLVLADAETVRDMAHNTYLGDTIARQLADADIVILNKVDLIDDAQAKAVVAWLKEIVPEARMIATRQARVAIDAVLGSVPRVRLPSDGTHADDLFDRVVHDGLRVASPNALATALATGPYGVVRAKGFVTTSEGARMLLHVVGRRWSVLPAPAAGLDGLVCIGLRGSLDRDGLIALLDGLQSTAA